ncbi:MAG: flagellar biosynthetic protein FliR [Rhodospirillales bacterium]|nr:flagellar biosynthetic protein FliR [Rhodospirillales bacterium]
MLQEFLALNIFSFLLIFARIGAALVLLPGFSASYVTIQVRLLLALAISFILTPVLAGSLPGLPSDLGVLALLLISEIFIGMFFGVLGRFLLAALQIAGTMTSYFMSMANAFIRDALSEQQSSIFANFFATLGIVAMFAADMHHLMIQAIADSYSLFIPGQPLPLGDFSQLLMRQVADSFALGVKLASPFLVVALVYYVGLGVVGRLMPALPVFFFGLPVQIGVQIIVMTISLSTIILIFLSKFEEGYGVFLAP